MSDGLAAKAGKEGKGRKSAKNHRFATGSATLLAAYARKEQAGPARPLLCAGDTLPDPC